MRSGSLRPGSHLQQHPGWANHHKGSGQRPQLCRGPTSHLGFAGRWCSVEFRRCSVQTHSWSWLQRQCWESGPWPLQLSGNCSVTHHTLPSPNLPRLVLGTRMIGMWASSVGTGALHCEVVGSSLTCSVWQCPVTPSSTEICHLQLEALDSFPCKMGRDGTMPRCMWLDPYWISCFFFTI